MQHTAFFGDGEKTFAFTHPLIEELQRKTGTGIGALFGRVRSMQFSLSDITEVIRLGLIGGGTSPAEASALVNAYVIGRPLSESFAVALGVLTVVFFGTDENDDTQDETRQVAASGDLAAAVSEALEATGL
jgi:uncharacterized membrane protein